MNNKQTTINDPLEKLTLVFYENDGQPIIGLIENIKDGRLVVLNERGKRVELQANRLLNLQTKIPIAETTSADEIISWLKKIRAEADNKKINLAEIWELLETENQELSALAIADEYLGKNQPIGRLATLLALVKDKIFFKRHGTTFSKRPAHVVQELMKQKENEEEKILRWHQLAEYLKKNLTGDKQAIDSAKIQTDLNLLSEFALLALNEEPNRYRDGERLFELIEESLKLSYHGSATDKALKLLLECKILNSRSNPIFIKRRLKKDFSEQSLSEAEALHKQWQSQSLSVEEFLKNHGHLEDQTQLDCFTIDAENTSDIDDALSLQEFHERYQLGIHISLVAAVIDPSSHLESEARKRMTSVYSSEDILHMLPESISSNLCSLVPNQPRPSLSCFIDLDRNFRITNYRITPTLIISKRKLSYQEVDQLLEAEDELFTKLYSIAAENETKRIIAGAIKISRPEAIIKISDNGELRLEIINDQSHSRNLVSEMMILYNSLLAEFAAKKNIPLIFRHQETSEQIKHTDENQETEPTESNAQQITFKPSLISAKPARHSSLGLSAYAQLTSPIRRYFDLVNQRQIFALFHQSKNIKFATYEEIEKIITSGEDRLNNANAAGRESQKFWLLRYLEQESKAKELIFDATIIRNDLKNPLIEIDQIFLITPVKFAGEKPLLGSKIKVKISDINPWRDQFRITAIA
ncbi:MAG TPA: RNB domain-containing ribonuclease [Oligoflexia bacterium]|nr:RNB domain-containing ribonuclease [Oligoflexia bacterium]HMP27577.1 RNB domain-containing ribonuclease [Oligoflexia bacterium]